MSDPSDNTPSRELVLAHSQVDLPIVVIPPPTPAPTVSRPTPDPAPKAPRSGTVKKWLIAAVIALVIIVAVLGGVLGSRVGNSNGSSSESTGNSDNSGPSIDQGEPTSFPAPFDPPGDSGTGPGTRTTQPGSTPTSKSTSICHGRICPSLLSIVQFSSPPSAFIFARGKDSAIWYRQTNGEEWLSNWETLNGDMKSQPMAASLENGQMLVVAYASNHTIQYRHYTAGKWNEDGWLEVGKAASSAPYVKACGPEEINVIITGTSDELVRNYYHTYSGGWAANWEIHGVGWTSDAVLGCSPGPYRLAGLGYEGAAQPLWTRTWSGTWPSWVKVGGDFRGNLAITSRNSEESLTFGITSNLTMSYHNWTRKGQDQVQLIGLEGSFQSVPVLIVMSVDRLDVLAVGTDDRLKHRALVGQTWAPEWQDLGGAFNSTPAAVALTKDKVSVYGLGVDRSMFHGTWRVSDAWDWVGNGDWRKDGKSLTLEAYEM